MAVVDFTFMKIAKILDATTLVLSGQNLGDLKEGDELIVVSVGPRMPEVGGAPLVGEKARVEVTLNAGEYIVARPKVRTVVLPGTSSLAEQFANLNLTFGGASLPQTVTERPKLPVKETDFTGNPASRSIEAGDYVIRPDDLKKLVKLLKERPTA